MGELTKSKAFGTTTSSDELLGADLARWRAAGEDRARVTVGADAERIVVGDDLNLARARGAVLSMLPELDFERRQ